MSCAEQHLIIVCGRQEASKGWSDQVLALLGLGLGDENFWRPFGERLIVAWSRELDDEVLPRLRELPGVERVFSLGSDEPLFARWPLEASSTVALGSGARCGDDALEPLVIAGPCSAESEAQLFATAEGVAKAGAKALRAGVFKPRTSPYSFGGLGDRGLSLLAEARSRTGLPVVTEVLESAKLDAVAEQADVLQIGSRNMHNSPLLFRVGEHPLGRPVLLKRGLGATISELLHAAEYVLLGRLAGGHDAPGLILCERGIRTFEPSTRFTLDLGAIPVLKAKTHLPIIADPSHAVGSRDLVVPLAKAALAAGADGLLVEVHHTPVCAWSDGAQCLDLESFRELMSEMGSK